MANSMPAIFLGHGNPMNAVASNQYTAAWSRIGQTTPKPSAVLSISAHWYIPRTSVTSDERPRTIHDFGGFPRELFEVQYPAPGSSSLTERVQELLTPVEVTADTSWGLDHGTWSVLRYIYPKADVPVVQLSIDETLPPESHFELAKKLAPLRDEGILVLGSGNLVHNLHTYAWGRHRAEPHDWALRFERKVRELIRSGDFDPLVAYESLGSDAKLSIPTPEHYLPLLYVISLSREGEKVTFPVEGIDGGSISMLAVQVG